MCAKSEYRNLSAITPQIAPHHPIFRPTEHTPLDRQDKKNNISLKIFKTLFFKIYNPTFNKIHIPHKTLFQNTSHHKPQHNFNTSFPCTTIFSPKTKTATINLIRLSEFYFTFLIFTLISTK